MEKPRNLNGVNLDDLFGTIDAIKETPKIAKFKFQANNEWKNGGHNRTTINEFYGACETHKRTKPFVFDKDEPPVLLGENKGANPVEYLLTALAGCITTSLVYHAAARGINIDSVEADFEGDLDLHGFLGLDENIRNGYDNIHVVYKVTGDATEEQLEELVEIAQQRSPVFDMVTNSVPVSVAMKKNMEAKIS